jgi:hypothetical protein
MWMWVIVIGDKKSKVYPLCDIDVINNTIYVYVGRKALLLVGFCSSYTERHKAPPGQ